MWPSLRSPTGLFYINSVVSKTTRDLQDHPKLPWFYIQTLPFRHVCHSPCERTVSLLNLSSQKDSVFVLIGPLDHSSESTLWFSGIRPSRLYPLLSGRVRSETQTTCAVLPFIPEIQSVFSQEWSCRQHQNCGGNFCETSTKSNTSFWKFNSASADGLISTHHLNDMHKWAKNIGESVFL